MTALDKLIAEVKSRSAYAAEMNIDELIKKLNEVQKDEELETLKRLRPIETAMRKKFHELALALLLDYITELSKAEKTNHE